MPRSEPHNNTCCVRLCTARQRYQDVLQHLSIISKINYTPMFEHGFLPWTNDHLFGHPTPPPTDNDRGCDQNVM